MTLSPTLTPPPPSAPYLEAEFRPDPEFKRQVTSGYVDRHDKSDDPANADKKVREGHVSSSPSIQDLANTNAAKAHKNDPSIGAT